MKTDYKGYISTYLWIIQCIPDALQSKLWKICDADRHHTNVMRHKMSKCICVFRVIALRLFRKSWIKGTYQKIYFLETLLRLVLQLKCWIFRSVLMARNRPTWHFGTELKLISTTSLRPYYRASSPPSPSVTYYGFQSPHGHNLGMLWCISPFLSTNL